MIDLTDYHKKEEVEKGLLKLINEKIEIELEEIIKWKIQPEPDDDYPDYDRERYYDNSGGYDLDLILDRNIGE